MGGAASFLLVLSHRLHVDRNFRLAGSFWRVWFLRVPPRPFPGQEFETDVWNAGK